MASVIDNRQVLTDGALQALLEHPKRANKVLAAEELQSEVDELHMQLRSPFVKLGRKLGLGDNIQSNYQIQCSWTRSSLQKWIEMFPSSGFPTVLPEYEPPMLHYTWCAALEDEQPWDILLVASFSSDSITLHWNNSRMRNKIDLAAHRVVAEELFNLTGKQIMLETGYKKEIPLYPERESRSLRFRAVRAIKFLLP